MPLYILREIYTEYFDDSDYGKTKVCEVSIDIAISYDKDKLDNIAENLSRGYKNGHWSEKRARELRNLYGNYDEFRDSTFIVVGVSDLIIS